MAQPASTFSSYDAIGNREDLSDEIYNVDPHETPGLSTFTHNKTSSRTHEWQTDRLPAADENLATIEGDDAVTRNVQPTVRLSNFTQIVEDTVRVTTTQEEINKAGRDSELNYQLVKSALFLKTSMEKIILNNQAKVGGSDVLARRLSGIPSWIFTNSVSPAGAGAADANRPAANDGSVARTDAGATVPFAEVDLRAAIRSAWDNGGKPNLALVGSLSKDSFAGFNGNATNFKDVLDRRIFNAADIYESNYGMLNVMPNRFVRQRDALVLQTDMWAVSFLHPMRRHDLARTGLSFRKQTYVEFTLESRNERASAGVFDVDPV